MFAWSSNVWLSSTMHVTRIQWNWEKWKHQHPVPIGEDLPLIRHRSNISCCWVHVPGLRFLNSWLITNYKPDIFICPRKQVVEMAKHWKLDLELIMMVKISQQLWFFGRIFLSRPAYLRLVDLIIYFIDN